MDECTIKHPLSRFFCFSYSPPRQRIHDKESRMSIINRLTLSVLILISRWKARVVFFLFIVACKLFAIVIIREHEIQRIYIKNLEVFFCNNQYLFISLSVYKNLIMNYLFA
jgi:hypothetical protein